MLPTTIYLTREASIAQHDLTRLVTGVEVLERRSVESDKQIQLLNLRVEQLTKDAEKAEERREQRMAGMWSRLRKEKER